MSHLYVFLMIGLWVAEYLYVLVCRSLSICMCSNHQLVIFLSKFVDIETLHIFPIHLLGLGVLLHVCYYHTVSAPLEELQPGEIGVESTSFSALISYAIENPTEETNYTLVITGPDGIKTYYRRTVIGRTVMRHLSCL